MAMAICLAIFTQYGTKKMLNAISAATKAFFFSIGPIQLIENRVRMELLKRMARKTALHYRTNIAIFFGKMTLSMAIFSGMAKAILPKPLELL